MSIETPQSETTTANNTTSHKGRTRVGWDVETLAWGSKFALVIGGVILAIIAALGLRWEDQADERREEREAKYKRDVEIALADKDARIEEAKSESANANFQASSASSRAAMAMMETSRLKLETSRANERAAKLELEAANAKLELEGVKKKQAPRKLNEEVFLAELGSIKAEARIWFVKDDPESDSFAREISYALFKAGWILHDIGPIPDDAVSAATGTDNLEFLKRFPSTARVGAQPSGVSVVANMGGKPMESKAGWALMQALMKGGSGAVGFGNDTAVPKNEFRIVVAPKPQ